MTGIPVYIFPEMFNDNNDNNDNLNFDINKIRFSDTSYLDKSDGMSYIIDMYYKNNAIIIQLPKYKLYSIENDKLILELSDIQFNEYFIKPIEEYICKIIHKKSEKWFNGKNFTMNKILGSLVSPFKKIENGNFLLNLSITKNTCFFNRYKNIIEQPVNFHDHPELITLIKIANVLFTKNKFSYNLMLEQAKMFIEEKLIGYSIIDTSEIDINTEYYNETECDESKEEFF